MAVEGFANQPTTTVTSGGTTAPASGTTETWTAPSWATFPPAVTGAGQYHVYDTTAGMSSELILVRNVSGGTASVTRGAEGTTPVAHSTPFPVTQAITAGWLGSVAAPSGTPAAGQVPVATGSGTASAWGGPGLAPSGDTSGATDTANIQGLVNLGAGLVQLQAGQFYTNTTVTVTSLYTYLQGAGRWATQWNFVGTGDCLRMYHISTTGPLVGGGVRDLTIDGTGAGAGSTGLHYGDRNGGEIRIAVQNFSGAGSTGVHLDNQYAWTEECHGYLWALNNTQNLVFDVSGPATTVAAGSNGGEISAIATWGGTFGGNGVLDVASAALFPTAGTVTVAASGATTAIVTYTGNTGTTLTGCAYVSGSATGTVSTGSAVTLATAANSFGYSDFQAEIIARVGQDGVVLQNGALLYNSRFTLKANFQGNSSAQTNAVLRITGSIPAGHSQGGFSAIHSCRLDVMAECSNAIGTNAPQTIVFGTLSSNGLLGCVGIMDFAQGLQAFASSNWTATGATGFGYDGVIRGDFNLNNATVGIGATYSFMTQGARCYGKGLLSAANGNTQVDGADYFRTTLTGNITISLNPGGAATLAGAQRKVIILVQAATGGPYTVTWPHTGSPTTSACSVVWAGGTAPTMSTGASAVDVYYLDTYDGATWYGRASQNVS